MWNVIEGRQLKGQGQTCMKFKVTSICRDEVNFVLKSMVVYCVTYKQKGHKNKRKQKRIKKSIKDKKTKSQDFKVTKENDLLCRSEVQTWWKCFLRKSDITGSVRDQAVDQ